MERRAYNVPMALFGNNRIYLDYASATPLREEARAAMRKAEELSGNPGAIHAEGVAAKRLLDDSRAKIARVLACKPREIIFTSGLTEANNLAILGFAQALDYQGVALIHTHWITSSIEHPSVLECFSELERLGAKVSHVEPEGNGVIRAEKVANMLRKETVFVSIGWANSEIGTVQPLSAIARAIAAHPVRETSSSNGAGEKTVRRKILFHSDAGQAPLYRAPVVHTLGVDLFSLGSGKLYGPRGVGALYVGTHAEIAATMFGGGQERGLRAGTESVALAAGFAAALACVKRERATEEKRLNTLRDGFAREILKRIPGVIVNGDLKHALPHMLNISMPAGQNPLGGVQDINSEYLCLALDRAGLALSTKAACSEGDRSESHVVAALGAGKSASSSVMVTKEERAQHSLRFSLGKDTTAADVRRAGEILFGTLTHLPTGRSHLPASFEL